jgi:hypothetical protein
MRVENDFLRRPKGGFHKHFWIMKHVVTALLGSLLLAASTVRAATYALGTSAILVGPAGGSNSVTLAVTPETGVWSASTNASWLHLPDSLQNGTGSTNVFFGFEPNLGGTRSGTLTIAGQTVTITQAGSTYVPAGLTTLVSGITFVGELALDNEANVYIPIAAADKVIKWTATNNTVTDVVSSAGLNYPVSVALGAGGAIFIADQDSGSIKLKIPGLVNILTPVSGLSSPRGVTVDAAGNLYIADTGSSTIYELAANSNSVTPLISMSSQGLAVDAASKNLYFGSGGLLEKWTLGGQVLTQLASSSFASEGVAVDGEGNVYIAGADRGTLTRYAIVKWTAVSNSVTTLVTSGSALYYGVGVDAAGNVYFTDLYNGVLQELPNAFVDPTPKTEGLFPGQDSLPPVVPATANLLPPFAPSSDSPWLTITGITNGVVSYSFTQNLGFPRAAHISLFGNSIPVFQYGPPSLTGIQVLTNGVLQFSFRNNPSASFTVLSSTNMTLPLANWTVVGSATNVSSDLFQFTSQPTASDQQRFYTIRTQ